MPGVTCELELSVTEVKADRRQLYRMVFVLSHRVNIDVSCRALFELSCSFVEEFFVFVLPWAFSPFRYSLFEVISYNHLPSTSPKSQHLPISSHPPSFHPW